MASHLLSRVLSGTDARPGAALRARWRAGAGERGSVAVLLGTLCAVRPRGSDISGSHAAGGETACGELWSGIEPSADPGAALQSPRRGPVGTLHL